MFNLLSGFLLFTFIFLLVFFFHMFCWNFHQDSFFSGIRSWVSSFECGFVSQGVVECSFSFTYFILLVFFVIFDLEISLLLNIAFQGMLYKNFLYYTFFILLLCFGFSAEISKGYISWGY